MRPASWATNAAAGRLAVIGAVIQWASSSATLARSATEEATVSSRTLASWTRSVWKARTAQMPGAQLDSISQGDGLSARPAVGHLGACPAGELEPCSASDEAQWSGVGEVDVELPSGVLGVFTLDGDWQELSVRPPSTGLFRLRMHWALNPEKGPFYSPFPGDSSVAESAPGPEPELAGVEEFCLVQAWPLPVEPS